MDHRSGGMKKDAFHLNKAANLSKNWGPPLCSSLGYDRVRLSLSSACGATTEGPGQKLALDPQLADQGVQYLGLGLADHLASAGLAAEHLHQPRAGLAL